MPARAQLVLQASTRRLWGVPRAQIAQPASRRRQQRPHPIHATTAPEVRSRDQVRVHARIATTGNSKRTRGRVHAKRVGSESLQEMTIPPRAHAHIASLANTNRIKEQRHASNVILASTKRPPDRTCAQNVPPVCSLARPVQRMQTSV